MIYDALTERLTKLEKCNALPKTLKELKQKTTHVFSTMARDQIHEQLNAIIKGDGGFIGLAESQETFRRWEVASLEATRILTEVESKRTNSYHHNKTPNIQTRFENQVN